MRKKVTEMTNEELYAFEEELTLDQLDALSSDEVEIIDSDVIEEVVCNYDFDDIEDAISCKEKFGVELTHREEDYLDWACKVDDDLGTPLM